MNRKSALALLGIAVAIAYTSPIMMSLDEAHASAGGADRGGEGGGGDRVRGGVLGGAFGHVGHLSGGMGGNQPRGFGSGGGGFVINDQVTVTECSDCHQPYGAAALPQQVWKRVMGNLANHFGEDASLDKKTRTHIENYLVSHAKPGDGPLRISEQPWFSAQHRGEARLRHGQTWGSCKSCHNPRGSWQQKR